MINQIRMLIAEWLLSAAVSIAPRDDEGRQLVRAVGGYIESKLEENRGE